MLGRFLIFALLVISLSTWALADCISMQRDATLLTRRHSLPYRAEFPAVPYAFVGDLGRGFLKPGRSSPRPPQYYGDKAPIGKLPTSTNGQKDFGLYRS